MKGTKSQLQFDEEHTLKHLKHYLPSQAPLKDFVHHNLLHAFQDIHFFEANYRAKKIFGYKTYLTIHEYREMYDQGYIEETVVEEIIRKRKGKNAIPEYKYKMLYENIEFDFRGKMGRLMHLWKDCYHVNISKYVQPLFFRIVSSYLDQGISSVPFPYQEHKSFLENIASIERNNYVSYFFNKKGIARSWLLNGENLNLTYLLNILVNDEKWYEDYLFDLCFEHPGWSGIIRVIEDNPDILVHKRNITLKESMILELLLQIDFLDSKFNRRWNPLSNVATFPSDHLFEIGAKDERFELLEMWQEAMEWSYYEKVLLGIRKNIQRSFVRSNEKKKLAFQSIHCIDDREESFRRYLECIDPQCETFGTAGFFNIDVWYQPHYSDKLLKLAPANAQPQILIKEHNPENEMDEDVHLNPHTHSLIGGWITSQAFGFWSALKLGLHVFKPQKHPLVISAIHHSDQSSKLQLEFNSEYYHNLKVGITKEEAAIKLEVLLKNIGLINHFAPIVYIIGHGAGSSNNPYYAAYDCGACSGKPGSVNARLAAELLNNEDIRKILKTKGIEIPDTTVFIAALHNTTSDKIYFFDTEKLSDYHKNCHDKNMLIFKEALTLNAVERARRFETLEKQGLTKEEIHQKVEEREYALFIPRPEYNHATNAICVVGKRMLTSGVFLDRRAFLNSYDYSGDLNGDLLHKTLLALTNVCGGINLEYYYSRTDNEKLGAGSKLPHNVFGLIGVSNGADGDLRYGLPRQMIEIHYPLRLLMIVQHYPDVIQSVVQSSDVLKNWFDNQWMHLVAMHPESHEFYLYENTTFVLYSLVSSNNIKEKSSHELFDIFLSKSNDLDVYLLKS